MRTTTVATAALAVALLVGIPTAASASIDAPPIVTAQDTSVSIAPGQDAFVDTSVLTGGTEYPGLYGDKVIVESGACTAEWDYEAGHDGVTITAPAEGGDCVVTFQPHSTMTSTLAEIPGRITVTSAVPVVAPPAASSPAPVPVPAGPIDDGTGIDEPVADPAPGAQAPSRSAPPTWQTVLALALASIVTLGTSGVALARARRPDNSYADEEIY
ncbi:hypothetical protein Sked_28910 [Sanguibacter keddieii DSM 10542]|uniref:Uncharacterized protein n=1 Tax=Sanguibacter keddieii (strain ATCC 51767 / DSM 10542 / NCFB 3025 / ST-74) TaxID=446469 RepID=D1BBM2_SANKS|nr:hypothetical protein [Sanguibacter keddieii]ACZ22793.1 hypothetical protein Sked_28910 [Sanguibacter keddieii DSM 10542]